MKRYHHSIRRPFHVAGVSHSRPQVQAPAWAFGYKGEWRSIADLIDICAAWDAAMRNLARDLSEVAGKENPPDLSSFIDDYMALANRYTEARNHAQQEIDDASNVSSLSLQYLVPNAVPTAKATEAYEQLLDAINPRWGENTWSEGDGSYDDLLNRIQELGATITSHEPIPQPKAVDANQLANAAVKTIEAPSSIATTAAIEGAKGIAKTTAKSFESILKGIGEGLSGAGGQLSWQTIAIIAGAVGLGLMVLPKMLSLTPAGQAYKILR